MMRYEFEAFNQYTSHKSLTYETEAAIDSANFNEIPSFIILPDGLKLDLIEEERFSEKRTQAGYAIVHTKFGEIRIKLTRNASPNYSQKNGYGSCRTKVVIRSAFYLRFC